MQIGYNSPHMHTHANGRVGVQIATKIKTGAKQQAQADNDVNATEVFDR